jgi:hypothetical protein
MEISESPPSLTGLEILFALYSQDWVRQKAPNDPGPNSSSSLRDSGVCSSHGEAI